MIGSKEIIVILSILFLGALCKNETLLESLPPHISSQLISLLTKQTVKAVGGCENPKEGDINLLLYTRQTAGNPLVLNKTNNIEIDANKKLVLVIHGWISSKTGYGISELKDAYLKRYDCNVIIVDWSKLAQQVYPASVCSIPKIAPTVASFLCELDEKLAISLNNVHIVGHSLGSQMAGLIGQNTKNKCQKKVGRITALDPAGPLFQNLPIDERLDKMDADFVDVIHTNEGALGYWGNCGDVDFHVNCGVLQLGCPDIKFTWENVKQMPMEIVACDHLRSLDYMTESLTSNRFKARVCADCPLACLPNLFRNTEITMGEDCSAKSPEGAYVLATHLEAPFGLETIDFFSPISNVLNYV